jgi:hypothetical protein
MMGGSEMEVWRCLGEKKTEMEGEGDCTALQEMGGKGRKNDLKIGHVKVQLECVRTFVSAFDRTRAECMCGK